MHLLGHRKLFLCWQIFWVCHWMNFCNRKYCRNFLLIRNRPEGLIYLFIYLFTYLLKLYLPLVHKIAFTNKFQLHHKIKYNIIWYISLRMKHPQSITPIFVILFLNSNNESLDFTTAGRLFHIREPRKWIAFVP